jgi:hypothetical protein
MGLPHWKKRHTLMGAGRQINNTVEAEQCRKHFRKVPLIKNTRLSVEQSADCAPIYQSLKKVLVRVLQRP